VCADLVRRLEVGGGSGEEEVQQGAAGEQLPHSQAAGDQLAALEQQRPETHTFPYS